MISEVHRRAILRSGGELVGVLGSSPTRSGELGARWGTRGFAGIGELLASEVDVVHVCSPNVTHADYALAALDAGAHVVCEKPVAVTSSEARAIAERARAGGLVVTVPFVYRYHPIVRELRERNRAGEFGELLAVHGSYLQDWMLSPDAGNWRVDAASGGPSRAFADIGSHWCDLVEFVTGMRFRELSAATTIAIGHRPVESVQSFVPDVAGGTTAPVETEDTAVVTLRAGRALGNVVVSQVSAGRRNRLWFELDGSRGSAVFDQENPETAWLGEPGGARVIARGAGRISAEQERLSYLPGGHAQGYQDCFDAFVADSYAAMRGEDAPGLPRIDDGVRAAELVEAVLASAASEEWVRIAKEHA
jgi:predicted dehydrogenase